MGKKRYRERADKKDSHGPSCMCRRCRAREDALLRERTRERGRGYKEYTEEYDE